MTRSLVLCCALAVATTAQAEAKPAWVTSGGHSPRYPQATFLVGFGLAQGAGAEKRAKSAAAADLARQVEVRIESEMRDVSAERDGKHEIAVASITRALTDVRLFGLQFQIFREGERVYALAVLHRGRAAEARRAERSQALAMLRACIKSAQKAAGAGQGSQAIERYLGCRANALSALSHIGVVQSLVGLDDGDRVAHREATQALFAVQERLTTLAKTPVKTFAQAVEALALHLGTQGVSRATAATYAPFTYANTDFSSRFGRQVANDLERLVAASTVAGGPQGAVTVRGVYLDQDSQVVLNVVVKETQSGKLVAGAQASFPRAAVPAQLAFLPQNFQAALQDQRILGQGEVVSGGLRVELWTNKGRKGLVFAAGEELKVFLRVNQPAYVRLVYVLQSGHKVPIEQAYFIDATKVNLAVEYPDTFEIAPPFGVEQMYAVAFTQKPEPLATKVVSIAGEEYEVVAAGISAMVKHRGIKRKKKKNQVAEAVMAVTTTAK